tara:strand:- start:67 stop:375 length:309 start_codon:yes stop_codon:yes gene_type:complete
MYKKLSIFFTRQLEKPYKKYLRAFRYLIAILTLPYIIFFIFEPDPLVTPFILFNLAVYWLWKDSKQKIFNVFMTVIFMIVVTTCYYGGRYLIYYLSKLFGYL